MTCTMFGKSEIKPQPTTRAVGNSDFTSVELNSVLYNGKTKPCTAFLAGASFVNAVEPLKKAGQLFCLDAFAIILKSDTAQFPVVFK